MGKEDPRKVHQSLYLSGHENRIQDIVGFDARAEGLLPNGDTSLVECIEPALGLRVMAAPNIVRINTFGGRAHNAILELRQ